MNDIANAKKSQFKFVPDGNDNDVYIKYDQKLKIPLYDGRYYESDVEYKVDTLVISRLKLIYHAIELYHKLK